MRFVILSLFIISISNCEEYDFNVNDFEKKTYSIDGFLEAKPGFSILDVESTQRKSKYYDEDILNSSMEYYFNLQAEAQYEKKFLKIFIRPDFIFSQSPYEDAKLDFNFYESYVSLKSTPFFVQTIGKKALKWGKGYAWNPVAFVEKMKNPNEPEKSLEGYGIATFEYIKSFNGKLKNISLTPVIIPVYANINEDFGEKGYLNFAGKIYALFYDTDFDFLFFFGKSRENSIGLDFSRNIFSNLEIHGEFSVLEKFKKPVFRSDSVMLDEKTNTFSYLLGIKYLSERETSFIFEYYKNAQGMEKDEYENYISFIEKAYKSFIETEDLSKLEIPSGMGDFNNRKNLMKNYFYIKISQKEPFNILYFTPSIISMIDIDGKSCMISPELFYNRYTNLNLKLKTYFFLGKKDSEFGGKLSDAKIELSFKVFF